MLPAILVTVILVGVLLMSLQGDEKGTLIARTPYNNPHSDAPGASENHLS
jgi:hypothetical protein